MLDSVFVVPPIFDDSYYGGVIHEIREMQIMNMGNYAHGNQPIQHMIYLYNFAGVVENPKMGSRGNEPHVPAYARRLLWRRRQRTNFGLVYIFSASGFYPVCPGSGQYVIGAPLFKKITVKLENGKEVVINAPEKQR